MLDKCPGKNLEVDVIWDTDDQAFEEDVADYLNDPDVIVVDMQYKMQFLGEGELLHGVMIVYYVNNDEHQSLKSDYLDLNSLNKIVRGGQK